MTCEGHLLKLPTEVEHAGPLTRLTCGGRPAHHVLLCHTCLRQMASDAVRVAKTGNQKKDLNNPQDLMMLYNQTVKKSKATGTCLACPQEGCAAQLDMGGIKFEMVLADGLAPPRHMVGVQPRQRYDKDKARRTCGAPATATSAASPTNRQRHQAALDAEYRLRLTAEQARDEAHREVQRLQDALQHADAERQRTEARLQEARKAGGPLRNDLAALRKQLAHARSAHAAQVQTLEARHANAMAQAVRHGVAQACTELQARHAVLEQTIATLRDECHRAGEEARDARRAEASLKKAITLQRATLDKKAAAAGAHKRREKDLQLEVAALCKALEAKVEAFQLLSAAHGKQEDMCRALNAHALQLQQQLEQQRACVQELTLQTRQLTAENRELRKSPWPCALWPPLSPPPGLPRLQTNPWTTTPSVIKN